MNASSESGLWATWMVLGMMLPVRRRGRRGRRGRRTLLPVRLLRPLRLLLKLVERRLVLQVLDSVRPHGGRVMGHEIPLGPGQGSAIVLEMGRLAPDDVTEQMARRFGENSIRECPGTGKIPGSVAQDRCMVPGVDV